MSLNSFSPLPAENHSKGAVCRCVKDHVPNVGDGEFHHIYPLGSGGPDVDENKVYVCPTTHTNAHIVERLWRRHEGKPPWELVQKFNYYTRELGRRAYQSSFAGKLVD